MTLSVTWIISLLVFSQEQHDDNIKKLMEAPGRCKFTLNDSKTIRSVSVINVLGYRVGCRVIRPDRLQALQNIPLPENPKALERVTGMFAYYSKWLPRFSDQAPPLRSSSFPLDDSAWKAFESLKKQLEAVTLRAIDEPLPFVVECDASEVALSATLNQTGRPIVFMSRNFQGSERHYAPVEKEATAIIEAISKWKHFLVRQPFTIATDQRSVAFIMSTRPRTKVTNSKTECWRPEMFSLRYHIKYRPGKWNVAADCLSRSTCTSVQQSLSLQELHERLSSGHPASSSLCETKELTVCLKGCTARLE